MWFHGVGALPLRPDSRSDGKSGGLRPRPDTQLARLAEPVPVVPEMLAGGHTANQHSNQIGNAVHLSTVDDTDVLLRSQKQASVKSNGAAFHASDSNCVVKPLIGVHKIGAPRSYPIPVKPPVVPNFIPKPRERRASQTSLPGSKIVTTPVIPASKPDNSETIKVEYTQPSKDKVFQTSSDAKPRAAEESIVNCAETNSKQQATDSNKTGTDKPKTRDGQVRSLASPSPKSSQLSLYLASVNGQESRRTPSPAPPVPPLPKVKTSLQNLIPPEERESRRSISPLQQTLAPQPSEYFLPIQKSPLKETTGKKSPLSDYIPTGKRSPLPDSIVTGRKSPLIESIVKNLVRKSASRTSIPEVHEPSTSTSKPAKKECLCVDVRRPPTPVRPKSVAFAIDDEENYVPPPPPPPRSVTNYSTTPAISKATSCPGIIYSPRKDILIVKQPLAIIKPAASPVQTIGFKSTASGKIVITGGGDIEAEVVNVVTAGGEVLSVVCEKQGGGTETCGACVKTGSGNFCVLDGNVGKTGPRQDLSSSLASLVGSSGRRSSITSLSGSSLASVVAGSCCGGSEFGGLIIGDDIIVMGASGGAGAGAKGAPGASEAESCGGGACRKILSGRHHHQQQQTPSAGQTVKPQPQQPKGGGAPGPGPGGGGSTQVREYCPLKYLPNSSPAAVH